VKLISKIKKVGFLKRNNKRGSLWGDSLYRTIKYSFKNQALYKRAFTHRSYTGQTGEESNERLEFLGDAVLGMIVTEQLYKRFPEKDEGELTKAKSSIVSRDTLALWAENVQLGTYLRLGRGEELSGGRHRKSLLANTFEALIGAIYLDGGIVPARNLICSTVLTDAEKYLDYKYRKNFKSRLLEFVQARSWKGPDYRVVADEGPDHDKRFIVKVFINDEPLGQGDGKSKKEAEQSAAREALKNLEIL